MRTVLCMAIQTLMAPCDADAGRYGPLPARRALDRQLQALLPGWHVIAEGQPGRTTVHDDPVEGAHRNGLTVLPAMLESHRPIDVVLVMLARTI